MYVWLMVSAKRASLDVGKLIRDSLNLDAIEVLGLYDIVVRANVKSLNDLWENYISLLNSLPLVGSCTTYLSLAERIKQTIQRPSAFILIKAKQSEHIEIQGKIFDIDEVQKVDIVLGAYDMIAEVVANSIADVFKVVRKVINVSNDILRTVTMITFPNESLSLE